MVQKGQGVNTNIVSRVPNYVAEWFTTGSVLEAGLLDLYKWKKKVIGLKLNLEPLRLYLLLVQLYLVSYHDLWFAGMQMYQAPEQQRTKKQVDTRR